MTEGTQPVEPVVTRRDDDSLAAISYYRDDVPHDPDAETAAITMYNRDGLVAVIERYQFGQLHDPIDGSPAVIHYHPGTTTVKTAQHFRSGVLSDPPDGTPAVCDYDTNGQPYFQGHYHGGLADDPDDETAAMMWFTADMTVQTAQHYRRGKQIDNPA